MVLQDHQVLQVVRDPQVPLVPLVLQDQAVLQVLQVAVVQVADLVAEAVDLQAAVRERKQEQVHEVSKEVL